MNQKMLFLLVVLMPAMIYSCKKNTEPLPQATSYPNFSQLKVGNYWIYEQYDINSTGSATSRNIVDSCYVEKDTIISGKKYFKIVKPLYYSPQKEIMFLKDSLHYIVTSNGEIVFSSQDFSNVLSTWYIKGGTNDTISKVIRQMADKNMIVTTSAGTFTTLNAKETSLIFPNYVTFTNLRYGNTRYAENIGIIIETLPFFLSSENYIERRLVRYHLN